MPKRFTVGEIWKGPCGGLWRVTHLTSDGDVLLRKLSSRNSTIRRVNEVPKQWTLLSAPSSALQPVPQWLEPQQ